MPRLVIFDDAIRGVDLPCREVVVGRSKRADIPIRDGILSRRHCSIAPRGSGYTLEDLKSANGTFVNGVRIDRADLEVHDVIELGSSVIVFLDAESRRPDEVLTRLRNPVKARKLMRRVTENGGRNHAGAGFEGLARPAQVDLLENLVIAELSRAWLRQSPALEARVSACLRELRSADLSAMDLDGLRRRIRRHFDTTIEP